MSETVCELCNGIVSSNPIVLRLSDEKGDKEEWSGHKSCIDELERRIKSVKNYDKLPVKKIINELNL
ncbi:hypothetical protein AB0Y20_00685 [Heyndrickxia oleronia]|uniref:hypothetical protein n=1 Tax=Heyndrickxia oleronia TaxID=38875 RepID=UPI003F27F1E4